MTNSKVFLRRLPEDLHLWILTLFSPQGREGEIRHLFRGFAFLHCKKLVENGGMFVCKTRHLVLAGGSKVSAGVLRAPPMGRQSASISLFGLCSRET